MGEGVSSGWEGAVRSEQSNQLIPVCLGLSWLEPRKSILGLPQSPGDVAVEPAGQPSWEGGGGWKPWTSRAQKISKQQYQQYSITQDLILTDQTFNLCVSSSSKRWKAVLLSPFSRGGELRLSKRPLAGTILPGRTQTCCCKPHGLSLTLDGHQPPWGM